MKAFPAVFELSSLDGNNGFAVNGVAPEDFAGFPLSGAGDINGDGFDDIVIGAPNADPDGRIDAGESYILFGNSSGFGPNVELSDLNSLGGVVFNGLNEGDNSGFVSNAGDVNGDGFDDIIIGAPNTDLDGRSNVGETYVIFGSSAGFEPSLDFSTLNGTNGFVLKGIDENDIAGFPVGSAGDFNGDGIDDLILGSIEEDPDGLPGLGQIYIVYGSRDGFAPAIELADLDGTEGFTLNGIEAGDLTGFSLGSAGDFNGDGFDDVIIGAFEASPGGRSSAGESYLVFGNDDNFDSALELADLNGTNGFVLNGIEEFDRSGFSVSGAGDINGDGFDDVVISADDSSTDGNDFAGVTYVLFGRDGDFSPSLELDSLDGTNGFVLKGIDENDFSGRVASGVGDINRDGFDDILIGAAQAAPDERIGAGENYLIFGRGQFEPEIALSELDGSNGFVFNGINPGDFAGVDVSGAGDFNGDGTDDLIIGAPGASPNGNLTAGQAFVVYGIPVETCGVIDLAPDEANEVVGTENSETLLGGEDIDAICGLDGNDIIAGGLGDDFIEGGSGDDIIRGDLNSRDSQTNLEGAGNDVINGGAGNDRIGGKAGDDIINGGADDDLIWGDSGDDILTGGLGNDVLVGDDFSGGQGEDTFVLALGEGTDTIADFEKGFDFIGLSSGLTFNQLSFAAQSILLGDETLAVLTGVDTSMLTSSDFVIM